MAEATGARSTATWVADQTRQAHGTLRRSAALAAALDQRWTHTAQAFAAGEVNPTQAGVIAAALDALPQDLGEDLLAKAETLLVEQATELGPRDLKVFGSRILEYLAPDIADQAEYRRLLAAERHAHAATRLSLRPRGDGSTDLHARIPDHVAGRLRAYLNAFTAPRRHHHWPPDPVDTPYGPWTRQSPTSSPSSPCPGNAARRSWRCWRTPHHLPAPPRRHRHHRDGHPRLPHPGRDVADTGIATTSTGDPITAGQARRLACQARIVPVVLGGRSEILDVGRRKRLVPEAIRKALNLRDQGCTEIGCTMPAEFTEAHHIIPWSRGGNTSLKDCKLLCSFHHHRAHDPAWLTHHHPNGKTSYTRRQ